MGWIVGILVFFGSLFGYMAAKNRKIKKLQEENEVLKEHGESLKQEIQKVVIEQQLQEEISEIKEAYHEQKAEIMEEETKLEETIPEQEEELSDEAKISAAAITQHLLDRQRKRMSKRTSR